MHLPLHHNDYNLSMQVRKEKERSDGCPEENDAILLGWVIEKEWETNKT